MYPPTAAIPIAVVRPGRNVPLSNRSSPAVSPMSRVIAPVSAARYPPTQFEGRKAASPTDLSPLAFVSEIQMESKCCGARRPLPVSRAGMQLNARRLLRTACPAALGTRATEAVLALHPPESRRIVRCFSDSSDRGESRLESVEPLRSGPTAMSAPARRCIGYEIGECSNHRPVGSGTHDFSTGFERVLALCL